jgi:hypothetical protein
VSSTPGRSATTQGRAPGERLLGRDDGGSFRTRQGWSLRERITAQDSYGVLLFLIVSLLVVTAAAGRSAGGRVVVAIMEGGVLLYSLWTARAGRAAVRICLVVVPIVVAVAAALSGGGSTPAKAAVASIGAALTFAAIAAIARRLGTHPRVDSATILGVLSTYLLIGIFFASVFTTVGALARSSFFVTEATPGPVDFLYFSFVTLTTVGYGDLTAAGDLGRMLAVTEALLGQLYLVTVVALVISNVGRERRREP